MPLDSKSLTGIVGAVCLGTFAVLAHLFDWGSAILFFAGGALLGAILLFWKSLQGLTGEAELSFHEALELAAPTAEEEQKVAVLRALKDLEYERSVGKISEGDYAELSRHYRKEAKRLLRLLDEELEPARKRAEAQLEQHLKKLGQKAAKQSPAEKAEKDASGDGEPSSEDDLLDNPAKSAPKTDASEGANPAETGEANAPDASGSAAAGEGGEKTESVVCESCSTVNDPDASFCKKCGGKLGVAARAEVEA
jgi:hypothetical protein